MTASIWIFLIVTTTVRAIVRANPSSSSLKETCPRADKIHYAKNFLIVHHWHAQQSLWHFTCGGADIIGNLAGIGKELYFSGCGDFSDNSSFSFEAFREMLGHRIHFREKALQAQRAILPNK